MSTLTPVQRIAWIEDLCGRLQLADLHAHLVEGKPAPATSDELPR